MPQLGELVLGVTTGQSAGISVMHAIFCLIKICYFAGIIISVALWSAWLNSWFLQEKFEFYSIRLRRLSSAFIFSLCKYCKMIHTFCGWITLNIWWKYVSFRAYYFVAVLYCSCPGYTIDFWGIMSYVSGWRSLSCIIWSAAARASVTR